LFGVIATSRTRFSVAWRTAFAMAAEPAASPPAIHIRTLKEQKQPKSAIEMAAIVAYYLSHIAPEKDHKEKITLKDLETQFKIADFKLPTKPQFTLTNTKNAGYLDSAGGGAYKLNPVGYNLVVHSLPRHKK